MNGTFHIYSHLYIKWKQKRATKECLAYGEREEERKIHREPSQSHSNHFCCCPFAIATMQHNLWELETQLTIGNCHFKHRRKKKKQENIEKLPHKNGEITFSRHKFAGIERFLFYMNRDKIVRRAYQRQQQANHVNF